MLLQHKNTKNLTMMNNGHPKESVIPLLAGFREIAITGMIRGIIQVERFGALGNQSDQTFIEFKPYKTNGFRKQAITGHQYQFTRFLIDQINGTNIHQQGRLHPLDDNRQRLIQVTGGIHLLDNAAQNIEHEVSLATISN